MKEQTLWIIAAPSCVGKSTFIKQNKRIAELTGIKETPPVHAAAKYLRKVARFGKKAVIKRTGYFHYCLNFNSSFEFCSRIPITKRAIVLVATKSTRAHRAVLRKQEFLAGKAPRGARRTNFTMDSWAGIYTQCLNSLEENNIPYLLINTEVPSYPIINKKQMVELLGG